MPWELQVCRFCGKGYGNKTGLRNHLSQYVGEWRIPADGIHDVLAIREILHPDEDRRKYRCPSRDCGRVISTRQKFTEHVVAFSHWGEFPEGPVRNLMGGNQDSDEESIDISNVSEWALPFDEEAVRVFEPEGPFPFLRLPPEVRLMIYEMTLCFPGISFWYMTEQRSSLRKGKVFIQHNTDRNPLALLITSRGIYEEARGILYGKNDFLFGQVGILPIFLIGIGHSNAKLLRSVRWRSGAEHKYRNRLDTIRPYIWGGEEQSPTSKDQINIWNDNPTYLAFLKEIGHTSCIEPHPEPHRLLRWNPSDSSRANRMGYMLQYCFSTTSQMSPFENSKSGSAHEIRHGRAWYELICQVETNG